MEMKKGTTTVGLVCKDGIILAADKRATAGTLIVDKRAKKVHKLNDESAVTIAGTVSDAQLIIKLLKAEIRLKVFRTDKKISMKETANLLAGLLYSGIRKMSMIPTIAHFLLGGHDKQGLHLYDLYPDGSVSKIRDYVSSGSGSVIAYGVLESQWKRGLSIEEGLALAVKALNAALQRDSASGNGIDVIKITTRGVERIFEQDLNTIIELKK
ncbi:proteasome subunit beta [Nanoarchaeota archaeon]